MLDTSATAAAPVADRVAESDCRDEAAAKQAVSTALRRILDAEEPAEMLSATLEAIRRQYQLIMILQECRDEWQGLTEDAVGLLQRMAALIGSRRETDMGDSTFTVDGQLLGDGIGAA